MKKRLLGFLICTMLVSMCVGCGGESTAIEQTETTAATTTENATPEQTTEVAATPEATEESHIHNYTEEITTDATCEADGLKTFTCECGDTYTEAIIASGHNYENYVYNDDATYLADGTETATCVCGLTNTRAKMGSKLEYTYTEMTATMYTTQTVNVRNLPNTDGEKIGSLSTNQEITVLGQCNETSWYQFELDGQTAFVSNSYLIDTPIEVTQNDGGTVTPAPNTSSLPNFPYPLHTWTQQTSAEGCPILVIYSTYSSIGEIRYGTPSPTPDIFRTDGELGLLWTTVSAYADTHGYGCHFLYPVTKVGDYAEGTIYQCIAGAHYSTTPGGCPNFGTGICKPGTID